MSIRTRTRGAGAAPTAFLAVAAAASRLHWPHRPLPPRPPRQSTGATRRCNCAPLPQATPTLRRRWTACSHRHCRSSAVTRCYPHRSSRSRPTRTPAGWTVVTGQLYGSGIALGIDGFRFGFFGGPGRFAPNQDGAQPDVMWLNLSTGQSSTAILNQHTDAVVDTTIRTGVLNPGNGTVVAADLRLRVAPLAGSRRRRPHGRLRLRQEHHLVAFAGRGDRELDLRSEEDLGSKPGVFFRCFPIARPEKFETKRSRNTST